MNLQWRRITRAGATPKAGDLSGLPKKTLKFRNLYKTRLEQIHTQEGNEDDEPAATGGEAPEEETSNQKLTAAPLDLDLIVFCYC